MKVKTMKDVMTRERSGVWELSEEDISTVNRVLLAVKYPKGAKYLRWLRFFRSVGIELRFGSGRRRSGRDAPTGESRLVVSP